MKKDKKDAAQSSLRYSTTTIIAMYMQVYNYGVCAVMVTHHQLTPSMKHHYPSPPPHQEHHPLLLKPIKS